MQLEVLVGFMLLVGATIFQGIHKVDEGYVAVYFRGGALLDETSGPGWHTKMPFVTQFESVQVTVQTDAVTDIPCGTAGGVIIHFDRIEVVNRLRSDLVHETVKNYTTGYDKTWIYDKIHHEINQFCSKNTLQEVYIDKFDMLDEHLAEVLQANADQWAPGIQIISIRVTKPKIPRELEQNYVDIERQKTQLKITAQESEVREAKANTQRREAKIKAESEAEIAGIEMQKQVASKEAEKRVEDIENEIFRLREQARADARHYSLMKQMEAEQAILTPQYLQKLAIESFANNTKIYFGESIPSYLNANLGELEASLAKLGGSEKN